MLSDGYERDYVSREDASVEDEENKKSRVGGWVETILGRNVSEGSSVSWGLLVLLAVGAYAIYQLIRVLIYFF